MVLAAPRTLPRSFLVASRGSGPPALGSFSSPYRATVRYGDAPPTPANPGSRIS